MPITVTMLQTRQGEGGALWAAGNSYSASDAFAQYLISSNLATGLLPQVPPSSLTAAQVGAVQSLVSDAWVPTGAQIFPGVTPGINSSSVSGLTSGFSGSDFVITATGITSGWVELQWHSLGYTVSGDNAVVEYAADPVTCSQAAVFLGETSAYSVNGLATRVHTTPPVFGAPFDHAGTNCWVPIDADFAKTGYSSATIGQLWGACKLRFNIRDGLTSTIRLQGLRIGSQAAFGRLAVVCDDGYSSFYRLALPILESYGIPVTFAIIPSIVGTAGFLTEAQLQDIVARGHDVVAHGPDTGVGNLFTRWGTDAEAMADVIATRDWIKARNLNPRGAADICYVWPQGRYNRTVGASDFLDRMTAAGFRVGRTATPASQNAQMSGRSANVAVQTRMTAPIIGHTYAGATNTPDDVAETANIATITSRITSMETGRKDGYLMLHDVAKRGGAAAAGLQIETDRLITIAAAIKASVATGNLRAVLMAKLAK